MSNCCQAAVPASQAVLSCPVSRTRGQAVELQTVKAPSTEHALRRLSASEHRFCPEPDCDVVYFDAAGIVYTKADLRVRVWQKEPFGDRVVCYCFGENEIGNRIEMEQLGRSDAVERVRRHIEAGRPLRL